MLKAMTAQTNETDDVSSAVSEILAQLDMGKNLLPNSAGILTCYPDFVNTGVVRALCKELPFDVAGATTIDGSVLGGGPPSLSLIVLTGDDVFFSAALSRPLDEENPEAAIRDVYQNALNGLPAPDTPAGPSPECALGLTFLPFLPQLGGDEILSVLDGAAGGAPLFGIVATKYTTALGPATLFNGENYAGRAAVVLLSGNVRPRFSAASITEGKISKHCATVTDSEGNILKAADGTPILEYLEKFGLAEKGQLRWELSIPLIVDRRDGTKPTSLIVLDQTPEKYVRMSASVPPGSTIRIGSIDRGDILESVADVTGIVDKETNAFLFFSCAIRGFALNLDGMAESGRVKELLGTVPYLFAYAGGEICPLYAHDGQTLNRFHNITAIGCSLGPRTRCWGQSPQIPAASSEGLGGVAPQ
jgi:hypothetical protein